MVFFMLLCCTLASNQYIETVQRKFGRLRNAKCTDVHEIKACFGLLCLLRKLHSSRQNLDEIWESNGYGIEKCRMVMSLFSFKFLIRYLRFDDQTTLAERWELDNLASIRQIFESIVSNCRKSYSPGKGVWAVGCLPGTL